MILFFDFAWHRNRRISSLSLTELCEAIKITTAATVDSVDYNSVFFLRLSRPSTRDNGFLVKYRLFITKIKVCYVSKLIEVLVKCSNSFLLKWEIPLTRKLTKRRQKTRSFVRETGKARNKSTTTTKSTNNFRFYCKYLQLFFISKIWLESDWTLILYMI